MKNKTFPNEPVTDDRELNTLSTLAYHVTPESLAAPPTPVDSQNCIHEIYIIPPAAASSGIANKRAIIQLNLLIYRLEKSTPNTHSQTQTKLAYVNAGRPAGLS